MYTYIVNWCCVHLYIKLVLCTLVQKTGFVYTCTVNWWWHVSFSYESNSRSAPRKCLCLSVCTCLHKICSLIAQNLNTDCKEFAPSLQFINSLSASKLNLSWAAHKNLRSVCFLRMWERTLSLTKIPDGQTHGRRSKIDNPVGAKKINRVQFCVLYTLLIFVRGPQDKSLPIWSAIY